ncbi:MAG: aldose 1-epimerase [Candidatus Limiplasma sp.]|nr:aldose 1-epimerase [Candidatus Limiplasma sp.]
MNTETCQRMSWSGRAALRLFAAGYEAIVVPSLGANVISLQTMKDGHFINILRTPPDDRSLLADPYAYGIPVLFPANRVAGGGYRWDGVQYSFPKNYPNDVHIHGVLHNREWETEDFGAREGTAWATFGLDTDRDPALRRHFPVSMEIRLHVSLDDRGLTHRFSVLNKSATKEIPAGLAYHTALRAHFCDDQPGTRLHVPLQGRCVDDETDRLPNGQVAPLDDFESRIALPQGADPLEKVVDTLYTARPGTSQAVLRDGQSGYEVVYQAGPEYQYWILWNQTAKEGFIAVEPQTWLTNAMHRPSPQKDGVIFVPPGQEWSSECSIFVRPVKE